MAPWPAPPRAALPCPRLSLPPSPLLQVLRVLLDRLKNDVTRLTAVKALATIARSPLNIDLSPVLAAALAELTSFLRKANRQLRQAALTALEVGGLERLGGCGLEEKGKREAGGRAGTGKDAQQPR